MKTKSTILLLKILFGALILISLIQFVFAIISQLPVKIQIPLFALRFPVEITDTGLLNSLRWYIFVCAIPVYALGLFTVKVLISLLQPLAEGKTPFTDKSIIKIRHIGFACWIYAAAETIIGYTGAQFLVHSLQNELPKWNIELTLPVISIIAGAILLSLAKIFTEGLALKKDNDSII